MSILADLKEVLTGNSTDTDFDDDLKLYANSEFSKLKQIGVGPEEGFEIESGNEEWTDFISDDVSLRSMVKVYIITAVRLIFNPPQNGTAYNSMEEVKNELYWRMLHDYEVKRINNEEE